MRSEKMMAAAFALLIGASGPVCAADRVPATNGDIEITPLIHSSVQIEHAGKVIQVDPWSLGDLSRARPADLILITDDVGHHLDVRAIAQLRKPGAPVVIAANGTPKVPDGIVLRNGESRTVAGVKVEAIAAYDLKQGEPSHPKGEANGYVIALGGKRLYFGGVTECVPEVRALENIDVAFVPMNIPLQRMTPAAAAACVKAIAPKIVYVYHYDQVRAARLANPKANAEGPAGGLSIAQSLQAFKDALRGTSIEVRDGAWYPAP
jgi:L-ascorbate metabolism protein UlaG (beta-lactamase superfamily)